MTPEGWTETKMKAAFSSRKEKGEDGLPVLSVTLRDGLKRRDELDRKMDSELAPEGHLRIRKGDIAYNMMRMWQGASGQAQYDGIVSPAYVVLAPTAAVDSDFMAYLLKHERTIYDLWAYSYGLTPDRLRLYFDDFCNVPLSLPPLVEQKKIADLLSTWDEAIEVSKKLLKNAEDQKKALVQQLFPSEQVQSHSNTERRVEVTLGELGEFFSGVTYSPDDVTSEDGLLVLRSSNIQNGEISLLDNVYVGRGPRVSTLTKEGDVIICVRNGSKSLIGKTAQIKERDEGYAHGAFMSLFRPHEPAYTYQLFQSDTFHREVHRNLGATINSINTSDLKKFKFSIHRRDTREDIARLLSDADKTTSSTRKQLENLRTQKAALMQQLLTGKRRVKLEGGA